MEYVPCNLCGEDNSETLFRIRDYLYELSDEWYSVVRCKSCGLVYVNPRPTEAEIIKMYPSIYRDTTPERAAGAGVRILDAKAKFLPDRPGRLLDIGCNKGDFLNHMRMRGWEVAGVEVSPASGNPYELNIHHGPLWEAGFPPHHFDAVTLWAVLEHVYRPREMLEEIYRILKPGGKLVVLVTNINSPSTRWLKVDDVPRHTTLFSRSTLQKMLRVSGFIPERFVFHNDVYEARSEGLIEYAARRLTGEAEERILTDWRSPRKRKTQLSLVMRGIRRLDQVLTRVLDNITLPLGLYGIMTAVARRCTDSTSEAF